MVDNYLSFNRLPKRARYRKVESAVPQLEENLEGPEDLPQRPSREVSMILVRFSFPSCCPFDESWYSVLVERLDLFGANHEHVREDVDRV